MSSPENSDSELIESDGSSGEGQQEADTNKKNGHECTICGFRFQLKKSFICHMNIHNRKFPCSDCGQLYGREDDLKRHRRTHAQFCPNCHRSFFSLRTHAHSCPKKKKSKLQEEPKSFLKAIKTFPFKCETCDAQYSAMKSLREHRNVHTDKFKCDTCEKCCKGPADLSRHKIIHTTHGKKTHFCPDCSYSGGNKTAIIQHQKKCKGKKSSPGPVSDNEESAPPARAQIPCLFVGQPLVKKVRTEEEYEALIKQIKEDCDRKLEQLERAFESRMKHQKNEFEKKIKLLKSNPKEQQNRKRNRLEDSDNSEDEGRIHIVEKPFSCQKCDYSASDKSSLRQHLLTCKRAKKKVRVSPCGEAETYVSWSFAAPPPPREPAHDHLPAPDKLFQPDWTDNGNQPKRFEDYDPDCMEEPRAFDTSSFKFARLTIEKTRSESDLHVKMDRMMQENERIGRAHQEAVESVLKMSDKFDQALELLKQHQNNPRPRRLISSASSDDESDENTPQDGRPKHRKTRRQRKKLISKKKEPQELEGEFITPINFNLAERCAFCWQNDHSSDDCSNYSKMKWRVGIKNFRMLCSLCLCFHPSRICFQPPTCPYCRDTDHHPAICPSDAHMAFLEQFAAAANES